MPSKDVDCLTNQAITVTLVGEMATWGNLISESDNLTSTASKTGTLRVDGSRHLDSACFFPPIDGVKFVALNFAVSF